MITRIARASSVGLLIAGLVLSGWVYAGDGSGAVWVVCGLILSLTAGALAGGAHLVFHTPKDRSKTHG